MLDLLSGEPFRTPGLLAATILGGETGTSTGRLVVGYIFLHFGTFALLGAATALVLRALRVAPGLLVGVVAGIAVLDGVYYSALLVAGADIGAVLPSAHVVAANVLGGMVLMLYLHHATHAKNPLGIGVLRDHPLLARGDRKSVV